MVVGRVTAGMVLHFFLESLMSSQVYIEVRRHVGGGGLKNVLQKVSNCPREVH